MLRRVSAEIHEESASRRARRIDECRSKSHALGRKSVAELKKGGAENEIHEDRHKFDCTKMSEITM